MPPEGATLATTLTLSFVLYNMPELTATRFKDFWR